MVVTVVNPPPKKRLERDEDKWSRETFSSSWGTSVGQKCWLLFLLRHNTKV